MNVCVRVASSVAKHHCPLECDRCLWYAGPSALFPETCLWFPVGLGFLLCEADVPEDQKTKSHIHATTIKLYDREQSIRRWWPLASVLILPIRFSPHLSLLPSPGHCGSSSQPGQPVARATGRLLLSPGQYRPALPSFISIYVREEEKVGGRCSILF